MAINKTQESHFFQRGFLCQRSLRVGWTEGSGVAPSWREVEVPGWSWASPGPHYPRVYLETVQLFKNREGLGAGVGESIASSR